MNQYLDEIMLVRTVKGAAASVLLGLILTDRRLNKMELVKLTGYSDKTVSKGLQMLAEMGLVEGKDRKGWRLSSQFESSLTRRIHDRSRSRQLSDDEIERSVAELRQRFSEVELVLNKLASLEPSEVHEALNGAIAASQGAGSHPVQEPQKEARRPAEHEAPGLPLSAKTGLSDSGQSRGGSGQGPDHTTQAREISVRPEEIPVVASPYPENPGGSGGSIQDTGNISGPAESRKSSGKGQVTAIENRNFSGDTETAAMALASRARKDPVYLSVVDPEPGSKQQTKQKQTAVIAYKTAEETLEVGEYPATETPPEDDPKAEKTTNPAELAWRWYYRTAEVDGDPGSLAAGRLMLGHPPPAGFLALAQRWPEIIRADQESMIKALKKGISCEQMAEFWHEKYPAVTASAFIALLALVIEAPVELDLGREAGEAQAGPSG